MGTVWRVWSTRRDCYSPVSKLEEFIRLLIYSKMIPFSILMDDIKTNRFFFLPPTCINAHEDYESEVTVWCPAD